MQVDQGIIDCNIISAAGSLNYRNRWLATRKSRRLGSASTPSVLFRSETYFQSPSLDCKSSEQLAVASVGSTSVLILELATNGLVSSVGSISGLRCHG